MPSVRTQIQDAASENDELLKILEYTNHAPSALEYNKGYMLRLKNQIAETKEHLEEAYRAVESELAEYEECRDSHVRRLVYRVSRREERFEEKTEKEKQEWLEALEVWSDMKDRLENLKEQLSAATSQNSELKKSAESNRKAKEDLDALYKSIFQGLTPDVPGEDEKEKLANAAEATFNAIQGRKSTEDEALMALEDAQRFLALALHDLASAKQPALLDKFNYGSFVDMSKDSKLSKARQNISQIKNLVAQAQRIQPRIGIIEQLESPKLRSMTL